MEELLEKLIKVIAIQTEVEAMRAINEVNNMEKIYYNKTEFHNKVFELGEVIK